MALWQNILILSCFWNQIRTNFLAKISYFVAKYFFPNNYNFIEKKKSVPVSDWSKHLELDQIKLSQRILETVQDFLIKLDIKPLMHLLEISIFSLNNDLLRLTKIMNNLVKDLKILSFKVIFQCLKLVESFQKKFSVKNFWLGDQLILMKFFEKIDI